MLHLYFADVRIINLVSRPDRRREALRELARIGGEAEFYPANRPVDKAGFPSIGARGCFESHLAILRDAQSRRLETIAILEDDIAFVDDFSRRAAVVLDRLVEKDWSIFYGGFDIRASQFASVSHDGLTKLSNRDVLRTSHFMAFRGNAIAAVEAYLEAILTRRPGGEALGPMHVDGAYNHFRWDHPAFAAYAATPAIALQRSSRSDISELRWFDKAPLVRDVAGLARRFIGRARPK